MLVLRHIYRPHPTAVKDGHIHRPHPTAVKDGPINPSEGDIYCFLPDDFIGLSNFHFMFCDGKFTRTIKIKTC